MPEPSQVTSMRTREASRAAFVARITAGVTHELRNVLAVVKESAGLVQDLLAVGAPEDRRADAALGRIEAQVSRGAELLASLNRLAHGLDRDEEVVDLGEVVLHTAVLCGRYARQRDRELEVDPGEGVSVTATANALDVYRALVAGVEWCVGAVPQGGTAVLCAESLDGFGSVRLWGRLAAIVRDAAGGAGGADGAEIDTSGADWAALEASLEGLPARVVRGGAWFSLLFA